MTPERALERAVQIGARSPCVKSKRGVVVFRSDSRYLAGEGYNAPPFPFVCDGSEACQTACGKVCVHAEQAVLVGPHEGGEMLHVKVVDGVGVPSGPPSCADCSKLILESGEISAMWLYEDRGDGAKLYRYTPVEFHRATLQTLGLPCAETEGDL